MGFIKCPECGNNVPDTNNSCDFCGYGIAAYKARKDAEKEAANKPKKKIDIFESFRAAPIVIIGFVLSLLGIELSWLYCSGIVFSIAAVVLVCIAARKYKNKLVAATKILAGFGIGLTIVFSFILKYEMTYTVNKNNFQKLFDVVVFESSDVENSQYKKCTYNIWDKSKQITNGRFTVHVEGRTENGNKTENLIFYMNNDSKHYSESVCTISSYVESTYYIEGSGRDYFNIYEYIGFIATYIL